MSFNDNTRLKVLLALVLIAAYVVLTGLYTSNIPDILFAIFLMQVALLLKKP